MSRIVEFKTADDKWTAFKVDYVDAILEQDFGTTVIVKGDSYKIAALYQEVIDSVWPKPKEKK